MMKEERCPEPLIGRGAESVTLRLGSGFSGQGARLHIAGLGDVGGTLAVALRLLGRGPVASVGLFDLDVKKARRFELECSQMVSPLAGDGPWPHMKVLEADEVFNCDIFVFCVTAGVPPLGFSGDVRLYQFERNARLVDFYAAQAVQAGFKGIFAVVSDPVDPLCAVAVRRLATHQVRGFGLGVMYARARYYASASGVPLGSDARVYGPHGDGLMVADSLLNYHRERSAELTRQTVQANLEVRALGFKPFYAPAVSSATYSLLAFVTGQWHFSALWLDESVLASTGFMGIYNCTTAQETHVEIPLQGSEVRRDVEDCFQHSVAVQGELLRLFEAGHHG